MKKQFAYLLILAVALSGCATSYTLGGQKYESKEKFFAASAASLSDVLATITPLPAPLTQRKLIFAIPSEVAFSNETVRRFVAINGNPPNAQQNELYANVTKVNYDGTKVYYDAVRKRNIYASTQFIDLQTTNGSLAASPDTDVIYYVEPAQGSGQWFYLSLKHDKQIFAYDRSSPTPTGRVQAFVDAVQVQAIRD